MSITLQDYHTAAQRLLHDSSYKFNTIQELTDYANEARRRVAAVTGCNRQIVQNYALTLGTTQIPFSGLIANRTVIGVLDIYLWYTTGLRMPLFYYPYSQFSRFPVVAYNYQGPPEMWSQVGFETAYVARIPDQAYNLDLDVSVEPLDLSAIADPETEIPSPFQGTVKFYMAYLAKMKNQQQDEADRFLMAFMRECNIFGSATMIRKLVGS